MQDIKAGDLVRFKNGGKAVIEDIEGNYVTFKEFGYMQYFSNGECPKSAMLDIIEVVR